MEVVFLLRVFLLLLRAVSWWREKSFEGNYLIRNLHNMNRTLNRCIVNTSYNIIQFVRMSRVIVLFFLHAKFCRPEQPSITPASKLNTGITYITSPQIAVR